MLEYKNGVILCAHGHYGEGLASAIALIAGEMPNLETVNFVEGDTFDTVDEAMNKAYDALSDKRNIVVLTDLKGGTPFNRGVITLGSHENVKVLSGVNFPMLYQALITDDEDIDDYVEEILDAGKEGIDVYKMPEPSDDDECSDGI